MENEFRRWIRLVEQTGHPSHDGDAYFNMSAPELKEVYNPHSRSTLIHLPPAIFLSLITLESLPEKTASAMALIKQGTKFRSLPNLMFIHDGKGMAQVIGWEGHHRAIALQMIGVEQIPIIFGSRENGEGRAIRWGERHRSVLPKLLRGDGGRTTIPFPQSEIFPVAQDP